MRFAYWRPTGCALRALKKIGDVGEIAGFVVLIVLDEVGGVRRTATTSYG